MGSKTKKTKTKTELPSWVTDASRSAIAKGEAISNREYQGFTGDRVAGLSENEEMASDVARTGFGGAQDFFRQGGEALGNQQSWTQADRNAFMNPYIETVVNKQLRDTGRSFDQKRAGLERTSSMRSAFGGGRQTMLESNLDRDHLETVGDISGAGYASAYDKAMDQFNQEQQRNIGTAAAFGSLGSGTAGAAGAQVGALASTGQTEREVDQLGKDFDYMQFIEQRDWDVNNLEPLLRSIQAAKHGQTSSTKEKTSGGGLTQIAGMAAVVGGFMTGNPALIAAGGQMAGGGG